MKVKLTINWFFLVTVGVAIWLGATGRVDWWVIVLIGLSIFRLDTSIKFDL